MRLALLLLCSTLLLYAGESAFETYKKEGEKGYWVKVDGFEHDIELLIGAGVPEVLSLERIGEDIALLHCYGGMLGTSVGIPYYYTYILNMQKNGVLGVIEYYDETDYGREFFKPQWLLKEEVVEVTYFSDDERKLVKKTFSLQK